MARPNANCLSQGAIMEEEYVGPKEPNLYKDLSQGTVTKESRSNLFPPKK